MGTLYIVATPIGNLKDITLRALETLGSVEVIAAEDTRTTRKLLSAHGISKQVIRCDAHAEARSAPGIVSLLEERGDVAFVTDAGTPGLSDPGKLLVAEVREAGFPVIPIPGPSAVTTLMSVAGGGAKPFLFEGFLSPKPGKRRKRLAELAEMEISFVLFESPFRVLKLLADLADVCAERKMIIGREMTKMHEEYLVGTPAELVETLEKHENLRGEFTILVEYRKND